MFRQHRPKVVFFLGREHHASKMMSLMIAMSNAGMETRVLISDNSINIDPSTEYLPKYGIPLNMVDHLNGYMDGYSPHKPEIPAPVSVPPFWYFSSYEEASRDLYAARAYFDTHKPEHFFVLHENNFFTKILLYAASQYSVKTYALQEGIILEREEEDLKKYSGGSGYADIVFSWFPEDVSHYAGRSKVIPTGPPHLDMWIARRTHDSFASTRVHYKTQLLGIPDTKKVVLFAPPTFGLYAGNPLAAIQQLINWTLSKGYHLVLKIHPFDSAINNVKKMYEKYGHVTIPSSDDMAEYHIFGADLVVTQVSTVAAEAAVAGLPVVEWDRDYIGLEQSLPVRFKNVSKVSGKDISEFDALIEADLSPPAFPGDAAQKIVKVVQGAGLK